MSERIINIDDDLELMDWGHGERFAGRFAMLGGRMGARHLGFNLTVAPAGKTAFPFHNHRVNDELFLIVQGSGEVRIGEGRFPVREGDLLCFPPGGPETAHQIINNSDAELRYLAVSSTRSPEIAEYPDSDKKGVYQELEGRSESGLPNMWRMMVRSADTQVDYWEGED